MDITERKITKIAREAEKLVLLSLREEGVGTAEIDLIHALRHHPGCTQAALAELLHADKAAIARRTKNLDVIFSRPIPSLVMRITTNVRFIIKFWRRRIPTTAWFATCPR